MEKFAENCKISHKFGVSRQIMDKIGVQQLCENLYIMYERYFNKLSYIFYFMKKSCLVLKLCHFKVYNVWISPKNSWRYCTFIPPRVRVRATVKHSATFFHDESSITIEGVRKCNSAK